LSSPHLEASPATTFRAYSSPAPTPVKPQSAPAILSQESVHTTLSITHHTRKRCSNHTWSSPPSFFDLMLHLTARLTREIWLLGSSYLHQMFPYERFYGFLKSLVHNRLFLEGAIVRGYETTEAWSGPWVICTHKTPLVFLAHDMKVGFQVLGPWGKGQSLWKQMPSKRLISP
jgi:hypothetical protein